MVAALIFAIVIVLVAYIPFWAKSAWANTIVQGYYMHQGVGMWFMLLCPGDCLLYVAAAIKQTHLFL